MIEKKLYHAEAKDMSLKGEYSEYPLFDVCKEENVTVVRSLLKKGCSRKIKVEKGTYTSLLFTDGKGMIFSCENDYPITEACVYIDDREHEFTVVATSDLTWTSFTVEMNEEDYWHLEHCSNYNTPYFVSKSAANAIRYIGEKSKTPGSKSYMAVPSGSLYRITIGFVEFEGNREGAFESPHPVCDQWQVGYGDDTDFCSEVAGTKLNVHKNDAQFFDGGQIHSNYSEGNNRGSYIYWELLKFDMMHKMMELMSK